MQSKVREGFRQPAAAKSGRTGPTKSLGEREGVEHRDPSSTENYPWKPLFRLPLFNIGGRDGNRIDEISCLGFSG